MEEPTERKQTKQRNVVVKLQDLKQQIGEKENKENIFCDPNSTNNSLVNFGERTSVTPIKP